MNILGRQAWFQTVDDTLGVIHTHLVAGFIGGFLTGIFAEASGCTAFACLDPGGAVAGNGRQVWVQIVGALFIIGLNIFMTSVICLFIKYVLRIPLRMTEEHLLVGDDAVHGEEAYALFFEGQRSHLVEGDYESSHDALSRHTKGDNGLIVGRPPITGNSSSHDEEVGVQPKLEGVSRKID